MKFLKQSIHQQVQKVLWEHLPLDAVTQGYKNLNGDKTSEPLIGTVGIKDVDIVECDVTIDRSGIKVYVYGDGVDGRKPTMCSIWCMPMVPIVKAMQYAQDILEDGMSVQELVALGFKRKKQ